MYFNHVIYNKTTNSFTHNYNNNIQYEQNHNNIIIITNSNNLNDFIKFINRYKKK